MWGMVLSLPNTKVVERAMAHGLLVNAAGGNVLRMLPPLIVDETAILAAMAILDQSLTEVSEES